MLANVANPINSTNSTGRRPPHPRRNGANATKEESQSVQFLEKDGPSVSQSGNQQQSYNQQGESQQKGN
jgi:hypothetical protein